MTRRLRLSPPWRVCLIVALLALTVAAVRGTLPSDAVSGPHVGSGTAAVILIVVFVGAVGIATATLVEQWRNRNAPPTDDSSVAPRERARTRMSWRAVLPTLGAACLAAAGLTAAFLFLGPQSSPVLPPNSGSEATAPAQTQPAQPPPRAGAGRPAAAEGAGGTLWWPAAVATVPVLATLLGAGTYLGLRRSRRPRGEGQPPQWVAAARRDTAESLSRAARLGLAAVAEAERDPRAAIIACYRAMEEGLSQTPGAHPEVSDTPSEVLARAVEHGVLRTRAAADLVALFAEARFSRHPMTERHRAAAAGLLRGVLDDLQSGEPGPVSAGATGQGRRPWASWR